MTLSEANADHIQALLGLVVGKVVTVMHVAWNSDGTPLAIVLEEAMIPWSMIVSVKK